MQIKYEKEMKIIVITYQSGLMMLSRSEKYTNQCMTFEYDCLWWQRIKYIVLILIELWIILWSNLTYVLLSGNNVPYGLGEII